MLRSFIRAQMFLTLAGAMLISLSICGHASAAVYWGNGSTIGRINLDGSHRLDGNSYGAYVGPNGSSIAGACAVAVDGSHVYWGNLGHGTIGRANLDGSEPNFAFISGANKPCGVAVDGSYIYWVNEGGSSIGRARLDGSGVEQAFIAIPVDKESPYGFAGPCGVAVNGSHIFWASYQEGLIGRASLDGKTVTANFIETPNDGLCGVAVNSTYIFWGSYSSAIGRAGLDGSNPNAQFITGLERPCGVAVDGASIYWSEQGPVHRAIGRANLDGGSVNRDFVTDIRETCGVAVDALTFAPPSPPVPQTSSCELGALRPNRSNGSAIASVLAPAHGNIQVLTKGLRWRVLSDEAPPLAEDTSKWRSRVKVWPAGKRNSGRRILRSLKRMGHATVNLRIKCEGRLQVPSEASKRLTLRLRRIGK